VKCGVSATVSVTGCHSTRTLLSSWASDRLRRDEPGGDRERQAKVGRDRTRSGTTDEGRERQGAAPGWSSHTSHTTSLSRERWFTERRVSALFSVSLYTQGSRVGALFSVYPCSLCARLTCAVQCGQVDTVTAMSRWEGGTTGEGGGENGAAPPSQPTTPKLNRVAVLRGASRAWNSKYSQAGIVAGRHNLRRERSSHFGTLSVV
jgi:hypothetical protein